MYNVHAYPFIGIIDPQTGEKLTQFPTKIDPCTFCEKVTTFLCDHETPFKETDQQDEDEIVEVEKMEETKKAKEIIVRNWKLKIDHFCLLLYIRCFKKMNEKPKKAADLIGSNKEIFEKEDIYDNEEDEQDDEIEQIKEKNIFNSNKIYEDDSVVSKEKFVKTEPEKFKEPVETKEPITKVSSQPIITRFETLDTLQKGKRVNAENNAIKFLELKTESKNIFLANFYCYLLNSYFLIFL